MIARIAARALMTMTHDSEDIRENLVNINTADVAGLTSLSGIGETRAKAIIAYREENGRF